jgi:hypothetical protein
MGMRWAAVRIPAIQAIRYEWQYVSEKQKKVLTREVKKRIISIQIEENQIESIYTKD